MAGRACGRVLRVPGKADPEPDLNTRMFLAGLTDWSGSGPPDSEAIGECGILAQGRMHVAAISGTGSVILGRRYLELDGLTGLREVTHRGGGTVWLYQGAQRLRPPTAGERCTLRVMSIWGRRLIQLLAENASFTTDPWTAIATWGHYRRPGIRNVCRAHPAKHISLPESGTARHSITARRAQSARMGRTHNDPFRMPQLTYTRVPGAAQAAR